MDWDNLKFFLALAQTGSLSRASEQLRVNHSTVARRIDMLEQELGVRLVERLPHSYRLTAEGERVRDRVKAIETGIADIARFAHGVGGSSQRIVRVNGPPMVISQLLSPRLLPLQKEHPGLRIELVGESRLVSLSRGEADIALRLSRPIEKGVVARRLAVVTYRLYGSSTYFAAHGEGALDFLGFDDSHDHLPQQRWLRAFSGNRVLALQASDLTVLLNAVRAGLGVAVLPCYMACREPGLIDFRPTLPPLTRELWMAFHRDVGRSPAVRAVIDRITQITADAKAILLGEQAAQTRT